MLPNYFEFKVFINSHITPVTKNLILRDSLSAFLKVSLDSGFKIQNSLLLHFLIVNILRIAGMELLLGWGHVVDNGFAFAPGRGVTGMLVMSATVWRGIGVVGFPHRPKEGGDEPEHQNDEYDLKNILHY